MTNQELFEKIKDNHSEKKIISCCNKLIKKCSFNSGADAENLCHLAYWLYVYGYIEEVEAVYDITQDVEFPGKGIFAVWDFLHPIWGLKVYLLKQSGNEEKAKEIIHKMEQHSMFNSTKKQEDARRNNIDFDFVCNEKKVIDAGSKADANSWRFISLIGMIGNTYTGFYPHLNAEKDRIEMKISEYLEALKSSK